MRARCRRLEGMRRDVVVGEEHGVLQGGRRQRHGFRLRCRVSFAGECGGGRKGPGLRCRGWTLEGGVCLWGGDR